MGRHDPVRRNHGPQDPGADSLIVGEDKIAHVAGQDNVLDPDLADLSLGTYLILDHIDIAREAGLPYVYLGYWVPGSRKMGYKASFNALEIYKGGRWNDIGDPSDHKAELHPLSVDPIAEQVARISLPETRTPRDA